MRFVAQAFVNLMSKFPFLETSAFLVIGILGIKLTISVFGHLYPGNAMSEVIDGEGADVVLSLITVGVFFIPILSSYALGYPKQKK